MALHFGYNDALKKHSDEIEDIKEKIKGKILQYTLKYSATALNLAAYSERNTSGYKYISAQGLNSKSTITLLTHSFSTSTGEDITSGVISYAFEFLDKNGNFSYYNIEEINIKPFKVPKAGRKYNMFLLNKTYVFSEVIRKTVFSDFIMFSVFITQKSRTLSNDTSEIELYITFKKNIIINK